MSTALLALAVVSTAVMTRGLLQRQVQLVEDLGLRLTALEDTVSSPDAQPAPRDPTVRPAVPAPLTAEKAVAPAARTLPAPPPTPPAKPTPAAAPAAPPEADPPDEDALQALLDEITASDPATPADVLDADRAATVLDTARRHVGKVRWSAGAWSRLAVLAALVGQDGAAKTLAAQAAAAGDPLTGYYEVIVRALLAQGHPDEAAPLATALFEAGENVPTARVLLAAALLGMGNAASADGLVGEIPPPAALNVYDQLVLARMLFALDRWEPLDEVLSAVRDVPPVLAAEHNFLQAAAWARGSHTVEALAILDALAAYVRAPEDEAERSAWPWLPPEPERYEIQVWRGVALMYTHQSATAREVLRQAGELNPERGEAQYYLGRLEARAGRDDLALVHLKNAVAADDRMAPAWEALASLELDAGQTSAALEHVAKALAINARRASAHFLAALANAKLARAQAAEAALRMAFALDPRYLEEAKQAEVLLRLFSVAELEALATPSPPGP